MILNKLEGNFLFSHLSANEIDCIFLHLRHYIRTYETGETIIHMGQECTQMLIILEGLTRAEMFDIEGKTIQIEQLKPVEIIAPSFLFGEDSSYPVTLIAEEKSTVLMIPKDQVLELLQKDNVILEKFLVLVSSKSRFIINKMKFLSFKNIQEKFIAYISEKSDHFRKNEINLHLSQKSLAELFGVSRPALARVIGELKNKGIIEVKQNGQLIRILDKEKLEVLCKSE